MNGIRATCLAALFVIVPTLRAEELDNSALLERLQLLELQVERQNKQLTAFNMNGGGQTHSCGDNCCDNAACCQAPAWYAGYEMTILRPYVSDVQSGPGFNDDYGIGHRFVLGYDGGAGMGARLRYWLFNHGHDATGPLAPFTLGIDMDVFDIEATLHERLRNWDIMITGGARYGRVGLEFDTPPDVVFEGFGPTVSLEALREFGNRGLYFVGNLRTSLLFGEISFAGRGLGLNGDDELTTVLENQLGIGWRREMGRADLNLRAVWESQFWLNDTFADDLLGFGSNLGFTGPTASLELRF